MKKSEIVVGGSYTDGKGSVRLILAEGPEYALIGSQMEQDNVRYRLMAKTRGPFMCGSEHNCTRTSFAEWAKERVDAPAPKRAR